MSSDHNHISEESPPEIQIVRMNSDKTRKDHEENEFYYVHFELSASPPPEWQALFDQEWNALGTTQRASIDESDLVVLCALEDIASVQLPALTKVVEATNDRYRKAQQQVTDSHMHLASEWRRERDDVKAVASSLKFEDPHGHQAGN